MRSTQRLLGSFASAFAPLHLPSTFLHRAASRTFRRSLLLHQLPYHKSPLTNTLTRRLRHSSNSSSSPERSAEPAPGSSFKSTTSTGESPETAKKHTSEPSSTSHDPSRPFKIPKQLEGIPHYRMTFTCKPCGTRSTHHISRHGYHKGTVLIRCPDCKNRHLISDHLKIFSDKTVTLEDILRMQSQKVQRGSIAESASEKDNDEDIEFWDENTPTDGQQLADPGDQK